MSIFLCTFRPKKSAEKNGAVILVTTVESASDSRAASRAGVLLEDYDADSYENFQKPIVTEVPEGILAPEIGVFDNTFHERYELNGNVWMVPEPKPESVPAPVEPETSANESESGVSFDKLAFDVKVAALCLFCHAALEPDKEQLHEAHEAINDYEANPEISAITQALTGIEAAKHLLPEKLLSLVEAIQDKYSSSPTFPQFPVIRQFAERWISTPPSERDQKFATSTPATAAEASKYSDIDIDMDVALGLVCSNLATANPIEVNRARNMVKDNTDSQYKRISMNLRTVSGITSYTREQIYGLTREILSLDGVADDQLAVSTYIANWISKNPVATSTAPEIKKVGDKFTVTGFKTGLNCENHMVVGNDDLPVVENDFVTEEGGFVYEVPPETPDVANKPVLDKPSVEDTKQAVTDTLNSVGYAVYGTVQPASNNNWHNLDSYSCIAMTSIVLRAIDEYANEHDISLDKIDYYRILSAANSAAGTNDMEV
ncbi:exonuclease family protein [Limnobaculum xujianqingii]|uniref:hypothetical protein n=1 Tax=Limnobaculum xujianqingii TaxID=2738837 RepID=UPI001129C583|nr:hypothetical protein [Limnobaculum xujianqingii]